MQTGIVPVRVDFGRVILEWAMIAVVAFAMVVVIGITKAGVKYFSEADSVAACLKEHGDSPSAFDIECDALLPIRDPDYTRQYRYALGCFLFGVSALVLTGLYVPWLGRPQEDAEKSPADRQTLIPAGYAWLWHSYRVPAQRG